MRISDWSSDVCSSDLGLDVVDRAQQVAHGGRCRKRPRACVDDVAVQGHAVDSAACRSGRHHQRIAGDDLLFHACDLDEGLAAVAVDPADRNGASARTHRTARLIKYRADRGAAAKLIYARSSTEEHTSELQSLMRNSYAV